MNSPPPGSISTSLKPGGYREILRLSLPLILSTSSISLMHVVDRVFLSWYSPEALAASLPSGAASWIFISLFIGTAGYVSTFVSQYEGSGQPHRVGHAVWQGVYFSVAAAVCLFLSGYLGPAIFRFADHPPPIQHEEVIYYQVMVMGGGGAVLAAALSSFFSGRGKTWTVLWVNVAAACLNGVLAYCMIFGEYGFPGWGIFGAAVATILSQWAMSLVYLLLIFQPCHRLQYQTLSGWRFEPDLFRRFIRYGFPSGLQFMVDVMAFTLFVLFLGRIGEAELAASNMAFTINHMVFMPMVGLSMGTSVLVGRYLGANQPDIAARSTVNAYRITFCYMSTFALLLVLAPDFFLSVFRPRGPAVDFEKTAAVSRNLLYFVAGYSLVDSTYIIFSSALKGAGDTRYVLGIMLVCGSLILVIPVYLAVVVFSAGVYTAWFFLALYVVACSMATLRRYLKGKWRAMRVIEHVPSPGAAMVEGPVVEG